MPTTSQNNAANVTAGKPKLTGAIFTAPEGSTLPTTATGTLDAAFKCMGYSSDAGLTNAITRDSDTVKSWGGDTVLTPQTEFEETFSFTLIEPLKKEVLEVVYGSTNVTEATGLRTVTSNSGELPKRAWVFDMVMSNGKARRIVVPTAKITEIGDITYVDNEPVGFELTVTATPDSNGNTSYTYDDISTSGSSGN